MGRLLFLLGAVAWAGTEPRSDAQQCQVHASLLTAAIGADFHSRAIPGPNGGFLNSDYLVVEVAVFPAKAAPEFAVKASEFRLLLNGSKRGLAPAPAGFVAASMKYPEWSQRPRLEASGGAGPIDIILGRPRPTERFPGDPSARNPYPAPPRTAPEKEPTEPALDGPTAAVQFALAEESGRGPRSGLLYFEFKGKVASLKRVVLEYEGAAGKTTLLLLQR